jgi:hypothetical protein
MRRSSVAQIAEDLGYDPQEVAAITFREGEIEVRERVSVGSQPKVWYILPEKDAPKHTETFDQILFHLNENAPVALGEVTAIRLDWRGVSVNVSNGLVWQIPYSGEGEQHE